MRFNVAVAMALWGTGYAFDCSEAGIDWLNNGFTFTTSASSPPTTTEYTIFFNPCSPVRGHKDCADDDHLCVVEKIRSKSDGDAVLSAVKSYGSAARGASESFYSTDRVPIAFDYIGSHWGSASLEGSVNMKCGEEQRDSVTVDVNKLTINVELPQLCEKSNLPDTDEDDDDEDSGWGFFKWLFMLAIFGAIAYAALTVYINFAQSRGNLPLAATAGDVLRDLPYLLRDVVRRIKQSFSTRSSTSGYAAL